MNRKEVRACSSKRSETRPARNHVVILNRKKLVRYHTEETEKKLLHAITNAQLRRSMTAFPRSSSDRRCSAPRQPHLSVRSQSSRLSEGDEHGGEEEWRNDIGAIRPGNNVLVARSTTEK